MTSSSDVTTDPPDSRQVARAYRQRSQIAAGVALIALVALAETWNVDRIMPNPASPFVWSVLGTVGVAASIYAAWCRRKAGPGRK